MSDNTDDTSTDDLADRIIWACQDPATRAVYLRELDAISERTAFLEGLIDNAATPEARTLWTSLLARYRSGEAWETVSAVPKSKRRLRRT